MHASTLMRATQKMQFKVILPKEIPSVAGDLFVSKWTYYSKLPIFGFWWQFSMSKINFIYLKFVFLQVDS